MSDFFISYSSEDREKADRLAHALESDGYDVWWDREIPAGTSFETFIEQRLNEAACALVLWSSASVDSIWVRAEASEALRQNKLVPVVIDESQPPLVFRQIQTADLRGWDGDTADPRYRKLVADVARLVRPVESDRPAAADHGGSSPPERSPPARSTEPPPAAKPGTGTGRGGRRRGWLALGVVAVSLAVAAALYRYLAPAAPPTIVRFEAHPDALAEGEQTELVWETAGADAVTLLPDRPLSASGSLRLRPESTTRFRLRAESRGGSATQSVRVVVERTADRLAAVADALTGRTIVIHGKSLVVEKAGVLEGEGVVGVRLAAGPGSPDRPIAEADILAGLAELAGRHGAVASSEEMRLSNLAELSHDLSPPAKPPVIEEFSAAPATVVEGDKSRLAWRAENASKVELDGKSVEPAGSRTVAPRETTEYVLTAAGESGEPVSRRVRVTVTAAPKARILSFEVADPEIRSGAKTVLSWVTRDATRVELNGRAVEAKGSITVTPSRTTSFRLTATGRTGVTAERTTEVRVTAPATPPGLWLVLSGGGRPLKDSRVRGALAHAVDWTHVLARLLPGRTVAPAFEIPVGSQRMVLAKYPYDRERAKRLLAEAGYPDGLGVYLYVDNEKMMAFGKLVGGYLGRAGVDAAVHVVPRDAALARVRAAHAKSAAKPVLFLDLERG